MNKQPNYPALALVKSDPYLAAVVSKVSADNKRPRQRDQKGNRVPNLELLHTHQNIVNSRSRKNSDAQKILSMLPDLELGIQILISSILSPADMASTELSVIPTKDIFSAELTATLTNQLKGYFEKETDIEDSLSDILRDILALKGSFPCAVIPENAIDALINRQSITLESLERQLSDSLFDGRKEIKHLGILGAPSKPSVSKRPGVAFENYGSFRASEYDARLYFDEELKDNHVSVLDNINVLKLKLINQRLKQKTINDRVNSSGAFSLESMSDREVEGLIYKQRNNNNQLIQTLKPQDEIKRGFIGKPLIFKLPSEAVIPVFVPGNPKEHIGYFVALDEEGNPLEINRDDLESIASGAFNTTAGTFSSGLIKKANLNLGNSQFDSKNREHTAQIARFYADMVEKDLITRVKNGIHGSSVKLAKNEEIYRVMLARSLSDQFTQLLYIPKQYLTYFAFKHDSNGMGVSLLDDTSLINTLRTVVLFTEVLSSIKNSIGRTKVSVTLPENDPDPIKTIEMTQNEIVRSRQLALPMGVTNPSDITDFIQRAAYEFSFEGHPGLPDLKYNFDQTNSNYAKPDSDLQDFLKKSSIMGLGLSPETVENGFSGEFATTVVANNILLSKRITQYQEKLNPLLSEHFRRIVNFSEGIYEELKKLIEDNIDQIKAELPEEFAHIEEEVIKKKLLIHHSLKKFLMGFEVKLPSPPSVTLEGQLQELETYSSALDVAIDKAYISSDFMTETNAGQLSGQIDTIKGMIKSYYLRKFMAEKGILTELSELTAVNENGDPQVDLLKDTTDHINALVKSCVVALSKTAPVAKAATQDLEKMGTGDGSSSDSGSDVSSFDSGGSEDDFDLGGDDLTGETEDPAGSEGTPDPEEPEANPEEEPDPAPTL